MKMKTIKWGIYKKDMSGECGKCGEHTLQCQCENHCKTVLHNAYCLGFTAPFGGRIEIKANKEIDQDEIPGPEEEIEGLHYFVVYNGITCPFYAETKTAAMTIALGIQWGAYFPINHGG
jgi:hypothetical protein